LNTSPDIDVRQDNNKLCSDEDIGYSWYNTSLIYSFILKHVIYLLYTCTFLCDLQFWNHEMAAILDAILNFSECSMMPSWASFRFFNNNIFPNRIYKKYNTTQCWVMSRIDRTCTL